MTFDQLIQWHPYPAEKPEKSGRYLITKTYDGEDATPHIVYDVDYSRKYDRWNWFDSFDPEYRKGDADIFTPYTTAWAEMPQVTPYEG